MAHTSGDTGGGGGGAAGLDWHAAANAKQTSTDTIDDRMLRIPILYDALAHPFAT
jgi:hypothetical protein